MTAFDADTLRALRDVQEPRIRTDKHPKERDHNLGDGGRRRRLRTFVAGR